MPDVNFSTQAVHDDAHKACCAMGMALSSFETRAEQDCISKHNAGECAHPTIIIIAKINLNIHYYSDVLKTKAVYFLGSTDFTCDKKFKWCMSGEPLVIGNYDWINLQPNYLLFNQHCMTHCVDVTEVPFVGFVRGDDGLNDWECFEKNQYICE
jgi:hypothetical protein